jgi:hypothetical protein
MWEEAVLNNLKYYPAASLKGLRKPTENFSQDILSPSRDLNQHLPYKKQEC